MYYNIEEVIKVGMRTVRLDEEAEKALAQIMQATGLSISGTFKQGILVLWDTLAQRAHRVPYEIYEKLDLGPGGCAIGPSTDTRRNVQKAIQRKLGR